MRKIACLLCLAVLAAAAPPLRSGRVDRAVDAAQPSVVKIFGAKGFRGIYGYMTGLIVHESGLVITQRSVTLEEASRIRCHLHDGRRLMAEIVREDRRSKMVLLRLNGEEGAKYPVAVLGASADVRPGQFVLLIGNAYRVALGTERCAVNLGVVSAITRIPLRARMFEFDYPGKLILHDAMNNPGVYGGPLLDLRGRVIGISGILVESRDTNAQVHYAIPIDDLRPFIDDTLNNPGASRVYDPGGGEEPGRRSKEPGYHGIHVLRGGINRATAAYVDRVLPDSPAARAGLRPDDLILKVDETRIKSWKSFRRLMTTYLPGQTARLTVKRGDEIKLFRLELEEKPQR